MELQFSDNYQLTELPQAWDHYCHIEETRTKYLAFFATVVLAATGFLVAVLKDPKAFDDFHLIGASFVIVFAVFLFSFIVWANIVRMGAVLDQYEHILEDSRARAHGEGSPLIVTWNVRSRLPFEVRGGLFSVQTGGEGICFGTCLLLFLLQAFFAWRFLKISENLAYNASIGLITIMACLLIYGIHSRSKVGRTQL